MASVTFCRLKEEYKLLSLKPNATENEVKKAYRRLALQYHPDVCKGDNCSVRFHKINEAYQTVMSTLAEAAEEEEEYYADDNYTGFDQWEEWMGFEVECQAGIIQIISTIIPNYNQVYDGRASINGLCQEFSPIT